LRLAFQADPTEHPVRILLATDAASEGIDLQNHCHRLVNYEIPFNPNKLEQRIGRVDRYGQRHTPEIFHFVGLGWQNAAANSYEADLEFLSRVARKVSDMEEDLGSVNAVLADAVQSRMLGRLPAGFDVDAATPKPVWRRAERGAIAAERNVREQVTRLHAAIDSTVERLGVSPANVQRAVATALDLARQQPLRPYIDDRGDEDTYADDLYELPPLTGAWARTADGVHDKLTGEPRPVTFDARAARGRDDVGLAHLGHPLVAMSTRLLRAAVWSGDTGLHRVTAVVSDSADLTDGPLVAAYARFVLVGADGVRLHEEVLHAGGWMREDGRFARLENLSTLERILADALATGTQAGPRLSDRFVQAWPRLRDGLVGALDARARDRRASLETRLDKRRDDERRRIEQTLDRFARTLEAALADDDVDQLALFEGTGDPREVAQARHDRRSWQERLAGLPADRERQLARVDARYADPKPHLFPVAVVCVVPRREAVR
jgi:hypothetical protein